MIGPLNPLPGLLHSNPYYRILKGIGGQYLLAAPSGETFLASARGLFRKDGMIPTPGDLVEVNESGDPDVPLRIITLVPRKNYLIRPTVANLDCLIITLSAAEPAPDFHLADKLLAVCLVHGIEPILCITKTDIPDHQAQAVKAVYEKSGLTIVLTNPFDQASHDQLRQLLCERVVSFAGQSGVGKSTLLNQLFGDERMLTGEISDRIGRGRHTTRHVELFPYAGGFLADTPGFTSFELAELGVLGSDLIRGYPELMALEGRCRFSGCRHLGELGCALEHDTIDPGRLSRYRQFRLELDQIKPYQNIKNRPKRL